MSLDDKKYKDFVVIHSHLGGSVKGIMLHDGKLPPNESAQPDDSKVGCPAVGPKTAEDKENKPAAADPPADPDVCCSTIGAPLIDRFNFRAMPGSLRGRYPM